MKEVVYVDKSGFAPTGTRRYADTLTGQWVYACALASAARTWATLLFLPPY